MAEAIICVDILLKIGRLVNVRVTLTTVSLIARVRTSA